MSQEECDAFNKPFWGLLAQLAVVKHLSSENKPMERHVKRESKN
jgi:hypothetical protein